MISGNLYRSKGANIAIIIAGGVGKRMGQKITKLKWIVTGGETGQESIRNGVFNLEGKADKDDTILVHDGVPPLIDNEVISDVIVKC